MVKAYEALWSLNRLQELLPDVNEYQRQLAIVREKWSEAVSAIAAGDVPRAEKAAMESDAVMRQVEVQMDLGESLLSQVEARVLSIRAEANV